MKPICENEYIKRLFIIEDCLEDLEWAIDADPKSLSDVRDYRRVVEDSFSKAYMALSQLKEVCK